MTKNTLDKTCQHVSQVSHTKMKSSKVVRYTRYIYNDATGMASSSKSREKSQLSRYKSSSQDVHFKASYWSLIETENATEIHISGYTDKHETVHVRVDGYRPYVYLELPRKKVKGTQEQIEMIYEWLQKKMGGWGPTGYEPCVKKLIYFAEKVNCLKLHFANQKGINWLKKLVKKCLIPGVGSFESDSTGQPELKIHEDNVDMIFKFATEREIKMADWICIKSEKTVAQETVQREREMREKARAREKAREARRAAARRHNDSSDSESDELSSSSSSEEEEVVVETAGGYTTDKISQAQVNIQVHYSNVHPYEPPSMIFLHPKYCSFDIECYSENHEANQPDAKNPKNKVYLVCLTFGRLGGNTADRSSIGGDDYHQILLTLFDPHDIPGVEIRRFGQDEAALLLEFAKIVRDYDPDLFIGYNIMEFDWNYMLVRAEMLGVYDEFIQMSRLDGHDARIAKVAWESKAYGRQEYRFVDCYDRLNMDVIKEVKKSYKLPSYSLNAVSKEFLPVGNEKDDVSYKEQLIAYHVTEKLWPLLSRETITEINVKNVQKMVLKMMPIRYIRGKIKEWYLRFLDDATPDNLQDIIREGITIINRYCAQDTILPIKLADRLNLYTNMEEMSNATCVPMSYIYTRGEQIKVLAQLYRKMKPGGYIVPAKNWNATPDETKYQGATVIEANPGFYKMVVTFDFTSLYPSIMGTYNIDYTTLNKRIIELESDPEFQHYYDLMWEDHVRCEHDPQRRKIKSKKDTILCKLHHYQWRKAVVHPDGRVEDEGLMPKLVRDLLKERKQVKKLMEKYQAMLKMHAGKSDADEEAWFMKMGWPIVAKGSLTPDEVMNYTGLAKVLDAKQKSLKICANSAYGVMGVTKGYIPLKAGAASITAMGRRLIVMAIMFILKKYAHLLPKLVYGDTDSCMITFEGVTSSEELFVLAKRISEETTHYLKCTILGAPEGEEFDPKADPQSENALSYGNMIVNLDFETVYGLFLLLTKKRYIALTINPKGQRLKMVNKGVVAVRRDNAYIVKTIFNKLREKIVSDESLARYVASSKDYIDVDRDQVLYVLYDEIHKIFTRQVPDRDFIIPVGMNDTLSYAKKKVDPNDKKIWYQDKDGGFFDDPTDCLDPRLVYSDLQQVVLGRKMSHRGSDVLPNSRMELVYLAFPNLSKAQNKAAYKAEDYTYYRNHKDELPPIDYLHYVEKQISKPVSELLTVRFEQVIIPYIPLETQFQTAKMQLDELWFQKLNDCNVFTYSYHPVKGGSFARKYRSFTLEAKVDAIIQSSKLSLFKPNNIPADHPIVNLAKRLKSDFVLQRIYDKFVCGKIPHHKPKHTEENLKPTKKGIDVVFLRKCTRPTLPDKTVSFFVGAGGDAKPAEETVTIAKGDVGTIIARTKCGERVIQPKTKRGKVTTEDIFDYDIFLKERKVVVVNVPRKFITTFTIKDSRVMETIYQARRGYAEVVAELREKHLRDERAKEQRAKAEKRHAKNKKATDSTKTSSKKNKASSSKASSSKTVKASSSKASSSKTVKASSSKASSSKASSSKTISTKSRKGKESESNESDESGHESAHNTDDSEN